MLNFYDSPDGFNIDTLYDDDPVVVDEGMETYNAKEKVDMMLSYINEYMIHYKGSHVFVTIGSDFSY